MPRKQRTTTRGLELFPDRINHEERLFQFNQQRQITSKRTQVKRKRKKSILCNACPSNAGKTKVTGMMTCFRRLVNQI